MAEDVGEDERSGKTERYGEDYSQREDVALILCRQNQIDKHDTEGKDD